MQNARASSRISEADVANSRESVAPNVATRDSWVSRWMADPQRVWLSSLQMPRAENDEVPVDVSQTCNETVLPNLIRERFEEASIVEGIAVHRNSGLDYQNKLRTVTFIGVDFRQRTEQLVGDKDAGMRRLWLKRTSDQFLFGRTMSDMMIKDEGVSVDLGGVSRNYNSNFTSFVNERCSGTDATLFEGDSFVYFTDDVQFLSVPEAELSIRALGCMQAWQLVNE
jgi:hypothetical protein